MSVLAVVYYKYETFDGGKTKITNWERLGFVFKEKQ